MLDTLNSSHFWPHQPEFRIVGGAIGLLLGTLVEFALMVVREQKAEIEEKSKNPLFKQKFREYNKKAVQSVIDKQKAKSTATTKENKTK